MNLPTINIRAFSSDQYQVDKVFYSNFYQLKGMTNSEKKTVVVDLGAFNGAFSFCALALGHSKTYPIEINPFNYKLLLQNLESFEDKVIAYNLGVYVDNTSLEFYKTPKLENGIYYDFASIELVDTLKEAKEYFTVPAFSLDYILTKFVREHVDILKINLGYAELEILASSSLIDTKVDNICFETFEDLEKINGFAREMEKKGFKDSQIKRVEDTNSFLVILSKTSCKEMFLIE